jgi:uncharacterized membrane protein (UPF0127 family)
VRSAPMTIADQDGRIICERCLVADRPHTRLRGLLGRRALSRDEGLLLRPSPSIHTWFMRFPIDAVFLDAQLRVIGVAPDLAPWRMAARRGARAVLELAAGEAARRRLDAGASLVLLDVHGVPHAS